MTENQFPTAHIFDEQFTGALPKAHGLYDPAFEKDSCGVGVHNKRRPVAGIKEDAVSGLWSDPIDR